MNTKKHYILITEGITDCSLLEAVLEKYLNYIPYTNIKSLPPLFYEMIGTYPTSTGDLKRQDSPTFYYKDTISIAIKQANGYSNIPTKISSLIELIDKLETYENFGGFLIFCDTDTKNQEEIKNIFIQQFTEDDILYENNYLNVYNHKIKCNFYLFPSSGTGAIEKLLLECANISYAQLFQDAKNYKDIIMTEDYKKLRKDCWASNEEIQTFYSDKVHFGAIASVLKPDRPVRFTIKDKLIRSKYYDSYMKLPEFQKLHNFLVTNIT